MNYENARRQVADFLRLKGFVGDGNRWTGVLKECAGRALTASLELPPQFPDELPKIFINRTELAKQIAHVESNGKVCIAPDSGLLIDSDRPEEIVEETLKRARSIIADGLLETTLRDLETEFVAYWNIATAISVLSICHPRGTAREIKVCTLEPKKGFIPSGRTELLADSSSQAQNWAKSLHGIVTSQESAFLIPLRSSFRPPDFEEHPTVAQFIRSIREGATPKDLDAFTCWLKRSDLPATLVLSFPPPEPSNGRILIGARVEGTDTQSRKNARRRFRPGKFKAIHELEFVGKNPLKRLHLDRFDTEYLVARGGGRVDIADHKVVLIGCGAVGSHIASHLAASGVGEVLLIDFEALAKENVHRHLLGVPQIGKNKAIALAEFLSENYPHQTFRGTGKKVQEVLESDPAQITEATAVVIALGNETVELRLNETLFGTPRLHAWLDPLGAGGHILATSFTNGRNPGCFRCLFKQDDSLGLYNAASFAVPGQNFQQSLAGCGGTFTPYGKMDADRTAIEATRLTVDLLLRRREKPVLVSWLGDTTQFQGAGYKLSPRAATFRSGECREEYDFPSTECSVCNSKQAA